MKVRRWKMLTDSQASAILHPTGVELRAPVAFLILIFIVIIISDWPEVVDYDLTLKAS